MALKRIRLELARDPGHPHGSGDYGYEFVAPLNAEGHLDAAEWRAQRASCTVLRFWKGDDPEQGHLLHTRGGNWAFHYDIDGDPEDDETGYKFAQHIFKVGEYVTLREPDGESHTFRVDSITSA